MEHERAFLEAIQEHPDDDLHRLAWADWLDDHGQTDRANFIRAQLRIASLPEEDLARDCAEDEADDLLAEHESEWLGRVGEHVLEWQWRRGCIERVTVWASTLLEHGKELFALAPIREIRLLAEADDLPRLAGCPFLARVEGLDVSAESGTYHRDRPLMSLLVSKHLSVLTSLELRGQGIEGPLIQTLIDTGLLSQLRRLDLQGNRALGDRAVRLLVVAGAKQLEMLDLKGTNIHNSGLQSILQSETFPRLSDFDYPLDLIWFQEWLLPAPFYSRLTTLTLPISGLGRAEGERILQSLPDQLRRLRVPGPLLLEQVEGLAGCAKLAGLRSLDLTHAQLRDRGAQILASSPYLHKLTRLNLGGNGIGGPGIRAVVNSPHLPALRELALGGNYVGEANCQVLAAASQPRRLTFLDLSDANLDVNCARLLAGSPALSRLRTLHLGNNRLGDEGVSALASSKHLHRLLELCLDSNGIDSPGAEALLKSQSLKRVVRLGLLNARISEREREQLRWRFGPGA